MHGKVNKELPKSLIYPIIELDYAVVGFIYQNIFAGNRNFMFVVH